MAKKIYTDFEFRGGARVTGLPQPSAPSDAVPLSYVQGQIEGLSWKDSVRAASTANLNLAAPGATLDGIALNPGDRILVKDQSDPSENGIYVFAGGGAPLVRADDANTFAELEAAVVVVEEGTANGESTWRQTASGGAIGVDELSFSLFGVVTPNASDGIAGKVEVATQAEVNDGTAVGGSGAAVVVTPATLAVWPGQAKRFATSIGDGLTSSFVISHNLNTRDVAVSIYQNGSGYDEVFAEVQHTSLNQITLAFSEAPSVNEYRVVVVG